MKTARWLAAFTLCAALITAPACNKKASDDKKAKDDMAAKADERPAPARAGASLEDKLLGKWTIDFDKMKETDADLKKLPADKLEEMKKMMAKMEIVVTKGHMTMKDAGGKVEKATWKVKSQEGRKIVLESKDEGQDKVDVETFEFTDDDHVKVTKAGEKDVMYAVRVK